MHDIVSLVNIARMGVALLATSVLLAFYSDMDTVKREKVHNCLFLAGFICAVSCMIIMLVNACK